MGTNVYMRHIPTHSLKFEIKDACKKKDNGIIEDIDPSILEDVLKKSKTQEIHIGKRSAGWKFLFKSNPEYYKETKKSIDEFIRNDDFVIYNEYQEIITPYEFWEDYYCDSGFDSETYYQKYPEEKIGYYFPDFEHTTEEGLRFTKEEFS